MGADREPKDLTHEDLVLLVAEVRDVLYLDVDDSGGEYRHAGHEFYNADKEWDDNTLEAVAEALDRYGLRPPLPEQPEQPTKRERAAALLTDAEIDGILDAHRAEAVRA